MARVVGYAAFQIPVMILSALVLALLLDSFIVRRPGLFRLSFFLPYAIPGVIAAMMWLYLYTPEVSPFLPYLPDSVNLMAPSTVLASMANMTTWTYTGYNMLIFLAALQAIPHDLYEAARIDGASGFQVATKIKIPLVRGAALLAVLLSIIGTIQLFNEPTIMASANPRVGPRLHPDDAHLQLDDGRDLTIGLRAGIRLLAADGDHRRAARSGIRTCATSKGELMTAVKPSPISRLTKRTGGNGRVSPLAAPSPLGRAMGFIALGVGIIYFLAPVFWLVIASTKSNADLNNSFGFWFA